MSAVKASSNIVGVVICLFALVISLAAQTAVPIEKEPMHRLKFENKFVRLFDILIPAGKTTIFHTHVYDGVGVRISNAEMLEEFAGGEKKKFVAKRGVATFGSGPPFSHMVLNTGTSDFRNIFIELLPQKESASTSVLPALSDGHVILIDNPRVRVNRLVLKPGESSKLHVHTRNGLGIIVYDANVEIANQGALAKAINVKAGDFVWQTAGTTHLIKNIGSSIFEAIDIELK